MKWTWYCHYVFQYSFPNMLNDKGTKQYNELVNILCLLDLYGNTRKLAYYSCIVKLFHLHFLQFLFSPSNTTPQSSSHLQDSPFISTLWYSAWLHITHTLSMCSAENFNLKENQGRHFIWGTRVWQSSHFPLTIVKSKLYQIYSAVLSYMPNIILNDQQDVCVMHNTL